jgi:AICAR transformylase/IMP cyclohydrolase PurH
MTETLAGSALMKEASECFETLQEYRSVYENPVGEVSGSDLKQNSLDLSFTKSQDVPYGSTTSQSADKYRMMITL